METPQCWPGRPASAGELGRRCPPGRWQRPTGSDRRVQRPSVRRDTGLGVAVALRLKWLRYRGGLPCPPTVHGPVSRVRGNAAGTPKEPGY